MYSHNDTLGGTDLACQQDADEMLIDGVQGVRVRIGVHI